MAFRLYSRNQSAYGITEESNASVLDIIQPVTTNFPNLMSNSSANNEIEFKIQNVTIDQCSAIFLQLKIENTTTGSVSLVQSPLICESILEYSASNLVNEVRDQETYLTQQLVLVDNMLINKYGNFTGLNNDGVLDNTITIPSGTQQDVWVWFSNSFLTTTGVPISVLQNNWRIYFRLRTGNNLFTTTGVTGVQLNEAQLFMFGNRLTSSAKSALISKYPNGVTIPFNVWNRFDAPISLNPSSTYTQVLTTLLTNYCMMLCFIILPNPLTDGSSLVSYQTISYFKQLNDINGKNIIYNPSEGQFFNLQLFGQRLGELAYDEVYPFIFSSNIVSDLLTNSWHGSIALNQSNSVQFVTGSGLTAGNYTIYALAFRKAQVTISNGKATTTLL